MTSAMGVFAAGGVAGADVRVPGAFDGVETVADGEEVGSADEGGCLSPAGDEQPATSADVARRRTIRIRPG
jgi:hypothetical protein